MTTVRRSVWPLLRWARRATQVVVFALFIYLLFAAVQTHKAAPARNYFLRFDPLAGFVTMLSGRLWLAGLALAVVTVIVTLLLGRVWCGWICPLGTMLGAGGSRGAAAGAPLPPRLRAVKYVLLVVIVAMAALGSMTLMVLDPLSLLTRTTTTCSSPASTSPSPLETAMLHIGFLQPP